MVSSTLFWNREKHVRMLACSIRRLLTHRCLWHHHDLIVAAAAQVVGRGSVRAVRQRWRRHFLWHGGKERRLFQHVIQAAVCAVVGHRLQAQQVWHGDRISVRTWMFLLLLLSWRIYKFKMDLKHFSKIKKHTGNPKYLILFINGSRKWIFVGSFHLFHAEITWWV